MPSELSQCVCASSFDAKILRDSHLHVGPNSELKVIRKCLGWVLRGKIEAHKTEMRKVLESPSLQGFKDSAKKTPTKHL